MVMADAGGLMYKGRESWHGFCYARARGAVKGNYNICSIVMHNYVIANREFLNDNKG